MNNSSEYTAEIRYSYFVLLFFKEEDNKDTNVKYLPR